MNVGITHKVLRNNKAEKIFLETKFFFPDGKIQLFKDGIAVPKEITALRLGVHGLVKTRKTRLLSRLVTVIHIVAYEADTTDAMTNIEVFVNVIEVLHKRGSEESWGDASKEIVYELDTPTLYRTEVDSERGVILEVGSRYEGVFGTADDTVLCERDMRHLFNSQYTTKIVSNHKGSTDDSMKVEMDAKTFLEFFVLLRQEVWNCRKNTYQKFLRVVNFLVALKPISKIYHPDGVTIGTQVFPDGTQSKQIKEVKYINKDSLKVLRYDGGITLETIISKKATRLFQMPSLFEAFKVDTRPPGAISGANVGYWSLDILRVHAMRLIQRSDTIYTDGKAVTYTKNNLQMTKIAEGYNVKMKAYRNTMLISFRSLSFCRCLLDQWNPTNKNQFLTKIVMIFGKDLYQLDVDTITDHFNVKKIEVWVCVNGADTLLRVVTELEGTTGIFVVLHTDGVEVQKIPLGDGEEYTARIIETKYLHPKTFQVEKYDGKVKLIKREMPKKTEIAIPMWRKALNKMEQVWLNMLRKWAGISDDYIRVLKRGLPEK
ncbi:hypothetical protein LSTR_LSTR009270 [Laodelphax striatellus]|uniref:Uncharacterized protein n=1 Tax=Laodelphax striatellus TaxID=195883 RepID=A0A482X4F4_LAOST|nr:hypothetical protein LSTR_LSTR009270 [Laodelphax striatellus]